MDAFLTPDFWLAVAQIIMIDILLGGDNAVVIALACRKLPDAQRRQGILWGTVGAILLRVVLIFFALTLLQIPYLKIAGAAESAGEGNEMVLVVLGLLVSIPIIVWGSQLVIKLMDRFPVVIVLGAMLLGWIAGTMMVGDPLLSGHVPMVAGAKAGAQQVLPALYYGCGIAGALLVLGLGRLLAARAQPQG